MFKQEPGLIVKKIQLVLLAWCDHLSRKIRSMSLCINKFLKKASQSMIMRWQAGLLGCLFLVHSVVMTLAQANKGISSLSFGSSPGGISKMQALSFLIFVSVFGNGETFIGR